MAEAVAKLCVSAWLQGASLLSSHLFFPTPGSLPLSSLYLQRSLLFEEATDLIGLAGKPSGWTHDSYVPVCVSRLMRPSLHCKVVLGVKEKHPLFRHFAVSCSSSLNNSAVSSLHPTHTHTQKPCLHLASKWSLLFIQLETEGMSALMCMNMKMHLCLRAVPPATVSSTWVQTCFKANWEIYAKAILCKW